jgi:predicted phage terminase large subunit-like protein
MGRAGGQTATPEIPGLDMDILRDEAACFSSLVKFRQTYLAGPHDVAPATFHKRWSDQLLRGKGHYACEGFRESGKDQIVFQAYLLHALTYPVPRRRYIVVVASTQTLASTKLKDVTRQFQSKVNEELRLDVEKVVEDSGQAFQVLYKDGFQVRIEAYGKGASIRGLVWGHFRPDILILNDLQDLEDMESPTTLEKDWNWFLGDVMFLGNSTRIFLIGNNLGESCIIERVYRSARELDFTVEKVKILHTVDGQERSAWPERFPTEEILAERASFESLGKIDVWTRERMCEAMAAESRPLKPEDLKYFDEYSLSLDGAFIVTMVDPGVGQKNSNDPTVICTVAIRDDGHWDVLDIDRDRRDLTGIVDAIFRAVSRWGPQSVGVETVAAQDYLAQTLEVEMRKRNMYFNLVKVKTRKEKNSKIRGRLVPLLKTGALRVPQHAEWVEDLKAEMRAFPTSGGHDDIIDTLSMIQDATVDRLIEAFSTDSCVVGEIPVPSHWPIWTAMVPDPEGEVVVLWMTCAPDGHFTVYDQLFANLPPETLYARYRERTGNRRVIQLAAPDVMWKEHPISGRAWAQTYMSAGFRMVPAPSDWDKQVANLNRLFVASNGSKPKLQVSSKCKRLLWELYNGRAGEAKDQGRKSIQALMAILSMGPKWRDMEGQRVRSGRNLDYPKRDVP